MESKNYVEVEILIILQTITNQTGQNMSTNFRVFSPFERSSSGDFDRLPKVSNDLRISSVDMLLDLSWTASLLSIQ